MILNKSSLSVRHFLRYWPRLIPFILLGVTISSCVTNKKYQMMQKGDVNKQNITPDSVFRHYAVGGFDYKVQTNDILNVRFESLTAKEFDFLTSQTMPSNVVIAGALLLGDIVDEHGEIPFPVVGKVKVAGMTVFQIQDSLQMLANRYLESPIVKVRLLNYRVTFLGEVNKEGTITFNNNRVNILEAIGQAGGLTDLADKSSVKLIRQKGYETEVIYINLLDENLVQSPYYYVYQNDVFVVPALKQRAYRKYFGQNLSLIISSLSLLILTLSFVK